MEMKNIGGHTIDESLLTDGCIIDVGCRGFEFSKYFKLLNDQRKIYCIDPDEDVFINKPDGMDMMNVAISDKAGVSTYYKNGEATMIRQFDPDPTYVHIDQKYANSCKVITMDDLYNITGENVDVLKLDCEGAEYAILGETFRPIPRQMSVEFHHHCVPQLHMEKIEGILKRLGEYYEIYGLDWRKMHGCDFNYWDVLFIKKGL